MTRASLNSAWGDEPRARQCQHPDCVEDGLYRAPAARDRLSDYLWFCIEHVREYNSSWDYFGDLNEEEIEQLRRRDTVWQRPSWPFGSAPHSVEAEIRKRFHRDFQAGGEGPHRSARRGPFSERDKALAALELEPSASFTDIKTHYKKLAKMLHPDANGGDRLAEERLKVINQAYATLKKAFSQ